MHFKVIINFNNNYRYKINMTIKKVTSKKVAKKASKILRDKRTGKDSKSVAGSALSQTPSNKKKKS